MSETLDHQPNERELALTARERRKAFHSSIDAKAAELRSRVVRVATALPAPSFFKECWFMIEGVSHGSLTMNCIRRTVAAHFGLPNTAMLVGRRTQDWVRPRQIAMYLCRELTARSMPEIGRAFGGADHTTVLHACRRVDEIIERDNDFAAVVAKLRTQLEESL